MFIVLGFELLAGALEGLPHGLVMLSLVNSGMSSRAGSLLSVAMKKNTHFASSLNKYVLCSLLPPPRTNSINIIW